MRTAARLYFSKLELEAAAAAEAGEAEEEEKKKKKKNGVGPKGFLKEGLWPPKKCNSLGV